MSARLAFYPANDPMQILDDCYQTAITSSTSPTNDPRLLDVIHNRTGACARVLLAGLLATLHMPDVDIRKPYTDLGDGSYSGRGYDEEYVTLFSNKNRLPINSTTGFLTPAFRICLTLNLDTILTGRPAGLYQNLLSLFDDVSNDRIDPATLLVQAIRELVIKRDNKLSRINSLLTARQFSTSILPLSSEGILNLIQQHLACKNSGRLSVLIIAAAYKAAEVKLGERVLPLHSHNAADKQTGARGDAEICLIANDNVVTVYEIKDRPVTIVDIDVAIKKIVDAPHAINNYLFITTVPIDPIVHSYAKRCYDETGGTEFAILDCIGFLRHFLHLFHRIRLDFVEAYQDLLLKEPDSAVSQTLKEVWLNLRNAAEYDA